MKIFYCICVHLVFYEELETEQHLMVILQDILEAQKHGESAEEYLGKIQKRLSIN